MSFLTMTAFAQQPTQPSTQQTWDAKKNPTVDSITSRYTSKYIAPRPALTTNDIFPVIGSYTSTNTEAGNVTVALDEQNKGVVWVTGLPQGRVKAMLRKSPAIYKIPAQKTAEGKDVAEGTLIFDKENNTLQIAIGKPYDVADPTTAFAVLEGKEEATVKTSKKSKQPAKPKVFFYTGAKVAAETVAN